MAIGLGQLLRASGGAGDLLHGVLPPVEHHVRAEPQLGIELQPPQGVDRRGRPVGQPGRLGDAVAVAGADDQDRRHRRPHRTPARLMRRLLRLAPIRYPDRRFVFVGDSSLGTREVARLVHRPHARLTLVSKPHPEADQFDPHPP